MTPNVHAPKTRSSLPSFAAVAAATALIAAALLWPAAITRADWISQTFEEYADEPRWVHDATDFRDDGWLAEHEAEHEAPHSAVRVATHAGTRVSNLDGSGAGQGIALVALLGGILCLLLGRVRHHS